VLTVVVDELMAEAEYGAAELVARNLSDELGHPEPHLTLFDAFAAALPSPRGHRPGGCRPRAGRHLPGARPPVAGRRHRRPGRVRVPGRRDRRHQGRRPPALVRHGRRRTRFWDVHTTMDADHGDWAVEALALLGADADEVADGARCAADAWWSLLDERQAEGLAA